MSKLRRFDGKKQKKKISCVFFFLQLPPEALHLQKATLRRLGDRFSSSTSKFDPARLFPVASHRSTPRARLGDAFENIGSKKDLRGRQHHTQEQEELKHFNLEKVVTTASGSDSGKALVSFDDEDEKIQESEPIASNVDSYFQQPLSSAQGIDQSPNLVQILTSTIDDDPNVELKSLGYGDYKGRKAEVYQLSKDSRKIKGHTMGTRTRIEPPNLDQIVTARIGDDLGEGLESLGGNHEGESDKDGSNKDLPGSGQTSRGTQQLPNLVQILTATNEGDPNPELEFCEDDKELELEYSMRDLSLQEPSPGEIEPSTDDQSVFATVDDDPDVVQFHYNEHDEEPAESNKDGRTGKPLSRPPTTSLRGKRRA